MVMPTAPTIALTAWRAVTGHRWRRSVDRDAEYASSTWASAVALAASPSLLHRARSTMNRTVPRVELTCVDEVLPRGTVVRGEGKPVVPSPGWHEEDAGLGREHLTVAEREPRRTPIQQEIGEHGRRHHGVRQVRARHGRGGGVFLDPLGSVGTHRGRGDRQRPGDALCSIDQRHDPSLPMPRDRGLNHVALLDAHEQLGVVRRRQHRSRSRGTWRAASSSFSVVPTWMNEAIEGLCMPIHVDAAPVGEPVEIAGTLHSAPNCSTGLSTW